MGRNFLCKPDGEKFRSSKLDGFFPKLDLKISSQTLRVQELFSKAWWEDFFTNGMQRFASPKLDDGILLLLKAWQIGLISKLNENWLKDSCCRLLGYEREWGWLEETNRRGFKQLEKQPRSTHNCHSLCTHTETLQLAANNDFLSERAGGTFWLQLLTKRDKKEKSVKLEKECQRKLENNGDLFACFFSYSQIGVVGL